MAIIKAFTFKIFIASENISFRNILASKLRLDNFDVEFASGGFHLLHILEKQKDIHMIICNGDMNDMSAHEIILMIRQSKSKTELPIVCISQGNSEEEVYDLILNGANEYIVQTGNFNTIIERAHKYMQQLKGNAA